MGHGKENSSSKKLYFDCINEDIKNDDLTVRKVHRSNKYKQKTSSIDEENHDKTKNGWFHKSENFFNSNNTVKLTRDPMSISSITQAKKMFYNVVNSYEESNHIKLCDISKTELIWRVLDYAENFDNVIHLKDDAKQFLPYRFEIPEIVKLYLYKLFYPRVFDFEISDTDVIIFRSQFIEENFLEIFHQIEFLHYTFVYDALLIAIEKNTEKEILSLKDFEISIVIEKTAEVIETAIKNASDEGNKRIAILHTLIPSVIFASAHQLFSYDSSQRKTREKFEEDKYYEKDIEDGFKRNAIPLLLKKMVYKGTRSGTGRKALIPAYQKSYSYLINSEKPFERLLNLYFINKRSFIFDLIIKKDNVNFLSYMIPGIATKFHINDMLNQNNLTPMDYFDEDNHENLMLTSIYNNPFCILSNITTRDYEMLDFIINNISISFSNYYFSKDSDINATRLCEFIDVCNKIGYTEKISSCIELPDLSNLKDFDSVDYSDLIYYAENLNPNGVMV